MWLARDKFRYTRAKNGTVYPVGDGFYVVCELRPTFSDECGWACQGRMELLNRTEYAERFPRRKPMSPGEGPAFVETDDTERTA